MIENLAAFTVDVLNRTVGEQLENGRPRLARKETLIVVGVLRET